MRNDIRLIDIVVYAGRLKDVDDLKSSSGGRYSQVTVSPVMLITPKGGQNNELEAA